MVKEVKFVSVDEGEFAFIITDEGELQILEVEEEEKKTYSKETVDELIKFLNTYWD